MRLPLLLYFLLFAAAAFSQEVIDIDGQDCDIHGTSKYGNRTYTLNEYKNRYRFPGTKDYDQALTLNDIAGGNSPASFSPEKAVVVSGYVYNVKMGGVESCNCKTKDPAYRDTHIELTPDVSRTGPQYRVIVEVTPRLRLLMAKEGQDWSTEGLRKSIKGKRVKIAGWLVYDEEHESGAFANDPDDERGARNWRATCWEIHPVTYIQVLDWMPTPGDASPPPTHPNTPPATDNNNNGSSSYLLIILVVIIIILVLLILSRRK